MSQIRGTTVLITGGASGLGYLTGRELLAEGAKHLVIWDIQETALTRVVDELTGQGYRVTGFRVDLADPAQVHLEMERARTGVKVTTVTPYYIDTGMFAGVRSPVIPILAPDRVASEIVAAIKRDKIFLRLPRVLNLLPLLRGIMPVRWFDQVAGEWLGVYHSMRGFRGRE
jgi:NAD(P)-dependent dehydrogenase (short-subunit alcohol dehydrogenase family)